MSLINEALKKAQRQRTEGTDQPATPAADPSTTPAQRVARREKPAGFRSQMLMAAGGGAAVLVIVLVIGGVWFWRSGQKPEPPAPKPEVVATHVATPTVTPSVVAATVVPAPAAATPVQSAPLPVAVTKPTPTLVVETPKPAPATTTAASTSTPQFTLPLAPPIATTQQAAPVVSAPGATEISRPAERPKAPVHMVTIIENLRVAGIRAAGDDSKVLMNDRVYRLNDIVDHELGIKLTGVTAKSLTFEDDHGAVYTRTF
jgi:hypothetical protein